MNLAWEPRRSSSSRHVEGRCGSGLFFILLRMERKIALPEPLLLGAPRPTAPATLAAPPAVASGLLKCGPRLA